jgi:hypothetical protein
MYLYHYRLKGLPPEVYKVEYSLDDLWKEVHNWMGVKLVLIVCK